MNKEQFKRALVKTCADQGLTLQEATTRIHEFADMIKLSGGIGDIASKVTTPLLWTLMGAPPLAGMAVGGLLGQAHNEPYDLKELRKLEEADELERAIQMLSKSSNAA